MLHGVLPTDRKHLKVSPVTTQPPFTVKIIDCVHQAGPMKGAEHPAVCYPHARRLPSLSLCQQEGQHPLTAQRAGNFNFSICSFHACICFMIYNGNEFAVFRL